MKLIRFLIAALALAVPIAGHGQGYPVKPVRLVITFPPGGPTDIAARLIAARMGERMGHPVIVDNRPGAGGVIGADVVAKAAADGYTLLLNPVSTHFVSSFVHPKLPYDSIRDFTPIASATDAWTGIAVAGRSDVSSLAQLVAHAKAQPGKMTYSSAGVGTLFHLTGEMFKQTANVDLVHVPYKGAAQAILELMSGQIDVTFSALAPMLPHIRSGKIKLVAVMDDSRHPAFPDVPTVAESIPVFQKLDGTLGFFGPAGLSDTVVQRVHAEISGAVFSPDVRAKLEDSGFRVSVRSPTEFARALGPTREVFGRAVKVGGLKAE